ncbi:MAG: cytochrome c-type biogenesis protein CcmH [Chloroflexi bacterium]|nr:cytochrome c-type biogenesis protein CcmH [Chloroflexota bacterium]
MSYASIIRTILVTASLFVILAVARPLTGPTPAHAQSNGDPPAPVIGPGQDREFEKRAQSLETQLICPICPGETLDQSFVQISQDMKRILREKLLEGEDEGQIKDFFVARYGVGVLASPPRSGFNLVTWVVPPIGVAAGVVALFFVLRQMRRSDVTTMPTGAPGTMNDEDLSGYLDEVDRDLSLENAEANYPPSMDDGPDAVAGQSGAGA